MQNSKKFTHFKFGPHQVAIGVLAASALVLAGCSSSSSSSSETTANSAAKTSAASTAQAASGDTINIVTSTAIWGDIAQLVADSAQGVTVQVTPILEGNSVDPHDFEPAAADIARAEEADIVVAGGGGYDAWLYDPLSDQDKVISALPLAYHEHDGHDHEGHDHEGHDHETAAAASEDAHAGHDHADAKAGAKAGAVESIDGNEHIWYSPQAITVVANAIADRINELAPKADANTKAVDAKVSDIEDRLHKLPAVTYAETEPIADYILAHTGMTNRTPAGYRDATLKESEPAAADLAAFLEELQGGDIDLLVYNPQTQTDTTERIRTTAQDQGVQVVEVGETPPAGTNFFDYYEEVLKNLETAASAVK